jgi:hypothetical protein
MMDKPATEDWLSIQRQTGRSFQPISIELFAELQFKLDHHIAQLFPVGHGPV